MFFPGITIRNISSHLASKQLCWLGRLFWKKHR